MSATTVTMPVIQQPVSLQVKAIRLVFRLLSAVAPDWAGRLAVRMFLTPDNRPVSDKAKGTLAQAQQVTFQHGSRQLQGYVWGEADQPAILLAHGWGGNVGTMRAFVRPLTRQGYRVIAFDAPAHGGSTGKQTTIYDYSGALQSICEQFGPVVGIIAHSVGSVATILMLGREAKLGVERAVVFGPPSNMVDFIQSWSSYLHIPQPVIDQMRQRLIDRIGLPLDDLTIARSAANITIPGLIIHDEDDRTVPYSNALVVRQHWSTSLLITTQQLDHRGALYNAEVIRQAVAFVTGSSTH